MKTALVTGSSRGIGAAIATQLVEEGWKVILHYSSAETEAKLLAERLENQCQGVIKANLNSPEETAELWEKAIAMGEVDALVNNAGIYIQSPFNCELNEWHRVKAEIFRVNFEAPCELMYLASQSFLAQGSGKVLNVASRVGFRGEAGASMYAASKAALINLTRSLAVEYAATRVGFFGIAPGWVDTSMARDGMEDRLPAILETIPAGRMASPMDCAKATSFLLSDGADYLTGTVIDINGASYFH